MQIKALDPFNPDQAFPDPAQALREPDGLLAYGGCLSASRLLNAYRHGIFPWYNPGEPILWWSPNPRLVLFPEHLKVTRSLQKTLRKQLFVIHYNRSFAQVMAACAAPRSAQGGTWISPDILSAYTNLHQLGWAHSVEAWRDNELVGGLYGVAIGRVFFGESMFHRETDASKVVFVEMVKQLHSWGYELIDCQVSSPHLLSLGAEEIPRAEFQSLLKRYCGLAPEPLAWRL